MAIFSTDKKVVLSEMETIKQRNQSITSVFARTVEDLITVNEDMQTIKERKIAEANALLEESSFIEGQMKTNENVMVKIKDFLN